MDQINKQLQYNEEHKMQHKLQIDKIKSYLLDTKIDNKLKKAASSLRANTRGRSLVLAFNAKIKHKNVAVTRRSGPLVERDTINFLYCYI
jgi:hypothetical protein